MYEQHVLASGSARFPFVNYDGASDRLDEVVAAFSPEQLAADILIDAARFLNGDTSLVNTCTSGYGAKHKELLKFLEHKSSEPRVKRRRKDTPPIAMYFEQAMNLMSGEEPVEPTPVVEDPFAPARTVAGVRLDAVVTKAVALVLLNCRAQRKLFTAEFPVGVVCAASGLYRRGGALTRDEFITRSVTKCTVVQLKFEKNKRIEISARNHLAIVTVHNFPRNEWGVVDDVLRTLDGFTPLARRYESITFEYAPNLRNDEMECLVYCMINGRFARYVHPDKRLMDDVRLTKHKQCIAWKRVVKIVGCDRPKFKCTVCCMDELKIIVGVFNELVGTALNEKSALATLFELNNVKRRPNRPQRSKITLNSLRTVPRYFASNYSKIVQRPAQPLRYESREQFVAAMVRVYGKPMDQILEEETKRVNSRVTVDDFLILFPPDDPSLYGPDPVNALEHQLCYPTVKKQLLDNGAQTIGCLMGPRRTDVVEKNVTTYIVGPSKRLQLHQNGQAEEYLNSVDPSLARVCIGIDYLCTLLCQSTTLETRVAETLPLWGEQSRAELTATIRAGGWRTKWALVERVFGLAICFVHDVRLFNSKLVDVEAHESGYSQFVIVKFSRGDTVEVYHSNSSIVHSDGPIVDFLRTASRYLDYW